ncbi:AMP-dependent synthetase and ligase [Parafrankia sp. Ea1.12]|uniref:non-ribosomal peptide synthetase n=1 Tax=Parafrankia sp. Ea1.12 TaxID=573499 RepID=UPI000DA472E5|nr:non-ribosomal peptide synthetase [Parafrankia sp. Ea1.12]SQD97013.1 AMP-dependent synthetase and ligase [Parafrankia sp. Ea1.12]
MRASVGVPFARGLRVFGDRLATVGADGSTLTYRQLADRVDQAVTRLGPTRRLVMILGAAELSDDPEPLVVYLAALAAGHPVLLVGPDDEQARELTAVYRPDVVLARAPEGWRMREHHTGPTRDLHPDLALLLSTSGSTGSAKLVRLSADGVQANAEAIASYLDIRDSDRAPVQLPIHYCYGLSVVNSNLARGAGLLLPEGSVTAERFWTMFREWGATSLHGVPYTFDLLRRIGFEDMDLPLLRYVTQAGGALAPQRIRELARLGRCRGWRFFAMYGQTEATARMAYLPPDLAMTRPESIGRPIPGGSFEIVPDPDQPSQGELVYRGPNVMMGYAENAADLAAGRTVEALTTGDIARRAPDGLYEIVGRASRFVKLFGLRIDLDRTERILAERGLSAACVGTDEQLTVLVTAPGTDQAAAVLATRLRLPPAHVRVLAVEAIPRRPNGKIDYPAVRAWADAHPSGAETSGAHPSGPPAALSPAATSVVRARFARILGHADVPDDATFVGLGGDSLTYVRMSLEIERVLGHLPTAWPTMPVAELERLAAQRDGYTRRPGRRRARGRDGGGTLPARTTGTGTGLIRTVEVNVVLRAVAVVLIVANHVGLFHLLGGAHLLLVVAGWSFARFCLTPGGPGGTGRGAATSRRILRAAGRIAVPSMLWLAWRAVRASDVGLSNVALIDNYLRRGVPGYWFVEVLVQVLVLLAALFAIPSVRRWEQRNGFVFALVLLGLALLVNIPTDGVGTFPSAFYVTHGAAWFFMLGWLACRTTGTAGRLTVLGIAAATVPGYFGNPTRETVVLVGLAALMFVPRVPLPGAVVALAGGIAGASLYTYLTHYAVYEIALPSLGPLPVLLLCLAIGTGTAAAAERARLSRPRAEHLAAALWRGAVRVGERTARGRRWAVAPPLRAASVGSLAGPILLGQPLTHAFGRLNRPG